MSAVLYEYTMTYPLRACQCGSRLVRHVRTERLWWFACSVCNTELTRDKIVELDNVTLDLVGTINDK